MSEAGFRRFAELLGIAGGIVVLDQVTKALILARLPLHETVPLIEGFLNLVHVRNPGAAFSLFADAPPSIRGPLFLGITTVAIVALGYVAIRLEPHERLLRAALGGVLGGALGNLIDRLRYGEVIDFIDLYWRDLHWPAFNVADSSITLAVATVLIHSFCSRGAGRDSPGGDTP